MLLQISLVQPPWLLLWISSQILAVFMDCFLFVSHNAALFYIEKSINTMDELDTFDYEGKLDNWGVQLARDINIWHKINVLTSKQLWSKIVCSPQFSGAEAALDLFMSLSLSVPQNLSNSLQTFPNLINTSPNCTLNLWNLWTV